MRHDPSDYISPAECAKRLGCSERHFKERVSKQKGFPKPVHKNYYWPDVHAFFAMRKAG